MTITIDDSERKLVGLLSNLGVLFLPFDDEEVPSQKVACIGDNGSGYVTTLNGSDPLEAIQVLGRRPIYRGDRITIQF